MARGFTNNEAKNLIGQAKALLAEFDNVALSPEVYRDELVRVVGKIRNGKQKTVLSEIKVRKLGQRYCEVSDCAPDLLVSLEELSDSEDFTSCLLLDGRGTERTLLECRKRALRGMRIDLDGGRHSAAATEVVCAACKDATSRRLAIECEHFSLDYAPRVSELIKKIEIGDGTLKWLFASRDKKDEAEKAYGELSWLVKERFDPGLSKSLDEFASLPKISDDEAWTWYASNKEEARRVLNEVSPSAIGADDWPFSSARARSLSNQVGGLRGRLATMSKAQPTGLESKIQKAVSRSLAGGVLASLKTIPVDELNHNKRGIRVKTLKDAGFETVADVYSSTIDELESVNGISYYSADDIKKSASAIAREVEKGLKLRLSADNRTPEATNVLRATATLNKWKALSGDCAELLADITKETDALLGDIAPATQPMVWLFAAADECAKAETAYDDLSSLLYGSSFREAETALSKMGSLERNPVSADEAWAEFVANPVAIFNTLEEVVPEALGNDDTLFGLPEELAREIQDEVFFPEGLKCTLRRYQEWGVKYILHQEKTLLGDEMGLGKTVQAIAAMVSLKNVGETRFLVVCPASVLENWCREIRKHSKLRVTKVHGRDGSSALNSWVKSGGAAVTTYETTKKLQLDESFSYGLAVVDEAHYIKNPEAARSKNTLRLLEKANRVVLMTGTALENKVEEMITLIGYLRPDIAKRAARLAFMSGAQKFRDEIAPVYYRRKREDVLTELPELIESEEWCTLGKAESEAYERAVLSRSIMAARQVSWNVENLERDSSKARRLLEIVDSAEDDGRKVLVFTFFLNTASGIANLLGKKCVGVINGSVPPAKRQAMVEEFDAAKPGSVLIAQIQSGGTGMNIQSASVVVFCEPQYKPSIENQAVSRAYRMGQTRNVLAFRLLCEDTVDERILDIIRSKQELFDAFADKSSAAAAAAAEDIAVDDKGMGKIIEEEIERIKAKNPELAAQVEREMAESRTAGEANGSDIARHAARVDKGLASAFSTIDPGAPKRSAARESARSRRVDTKMAPRFCSNCGNEFAFGTKFCCYCGAKLPSASLN